jgi:hypothetical protein
MGEGGKMVKKELRRSEGGEPGPGRAQRLAWSPCRH